MIKLTRLNGNAVIINVDLIKYIESTPDTKITFVNNDMLLIKESVDEVVRKAKEYKKELFAGFAVFKGDSKC
ncbi:MAG: flagellar FlbD family protein [Oligoflexia bacterium]|nr:flagellar FlbD family protein [Oligoflexia bacterium]MBF0365161.1 flagellar FlbD family protein [Oligoflexia bacterium]